MTRAYVRGIAARLEEHSIPEPNSGCYLWTGSLRSGGYGKINIDGRSHSAHRIAWIEKHGPCPDDLVIRHECDVPSCVNVDHLETGTHQDNANDRQQRGRHRFGIPATKCTQEMTVAIRADGRDNTAIARAYGISRRHVRDIKAGRRWAPAPHLKSESAP